MISACCNAHTHHVSQKTVRVCIFSDRHRFQIITQLPFALLGHRALLELQHKRSPFVALQLIRSHLSTPTIISFHILRMTMTSGMPGLLAASVSKQRERLAGLYAFRARLCAAGSTGASMPASAPDASEGPASLLPAARSHISQVSTQSVMPDCAVQDLSHEGTPLCSAPVGLS